MEYTVVGIQRLKSKKNGKNYLVLHTVHDFDTNSKNATGQCVETLVVEDNGIHIEVGYSVKPIWTRGFNGQAVLENIEIM